MEGKQCANHNRVLKKHTQGHKGHPEGWSTSFLSVLLLGEYAHFSIGIYTVSILRIWSPGQQHQNHLVSVGNTRSPVSCQIY